jgi:MFS superfamily sulfate permease-like transporter
MNSSNNNSLFANLKNDATSGLVVFLIAVPLCLGIALACGAPLIAGINAGIVGGIVVGFLSKSQLSVSGPAAGLTAIVASAIISLGRFELFLCAVIVAGIFQFILGMIRAGSISSYFPSNVIEGMLAAIGVIIILKEIPHAIGYDKDNEGDFFFVEASGDNTFSAITHAINYIHPGAVIVGLVSLAILILWQRPVFRKIQWLPGGLVAVLAGTLVNEIMIRMNSGWTIMSSHLVRLPVPKNFSEYLDQYIMPDFSGFMMPEVWQIGLVLAVVASIESLLCVEATDKLDPMKRLTSGNAELRAQGIGNIVAGLIGALPVTSVIVRSSANINAGARSKMSTIIHGTLLLVCVALIPALINHIPLASLAAILIVTGYRLCKPSVAIHMWKEGGINQFVPFIITVVAVVLTDLLKGVGIGLVTSIIFMLRNNISIPYSYNRSRYSSNDLIKINLSQQVSFLNKASIKKTLQAIPYNASVIIDASNTDYIDFDVLDTIREFQLSTAPQKKIKVSLTGFRDLHNVSSSISQHELISDLMHVDEVPERSAGDHKELLKQLRENAEKPANNENIKG